MPSLAYANSAATTSGRANAETEDAHHVIRDILGAREMNLKHTRQLTDIRSGARPRIADGGGLAVQPKPDSDAIGTRSTSTTMMTSPAPFPPLAADFAD